MQDLLESQTSPIFTIPLEIVFHTLIPLLPLSSLLSLAQTCKYFAAACGNEVVWKVKLREEFNFGGGGGVDARVGGWKRLYKGMYRPRVFLWGSRGENRLGGVDESEKMEFRGAAYGGVPYPMELKVKFGVRIVGLVAGGWSFHALDDNGKIHVWGALDGSRPALRSDGYEEPCKITSPVVLDLPTQITSIRCGRAHSIALDRKNQVWLFTNWGHPVHLTSPLLAHSSITQVEAGWDSSVALTKSGSVFIIRKEGEIVREVKEDEMNARGEENKVIANSDGVVGCRTWEVGVDPVELPSSPEDLPLLEEEDEGPDKKAKIVKVAAGDRFVIALTDKGHVLKLDFGDESDEEMRKGFASIIGGRRWEYLPEFSELERVRSQPVFSTSIGAKNAVQPPEAMRITHISAAFKTFFAYSVSADSSSTVLQGSRATTPTTPPTILPSLQNRSIISVVLGDYHFAALTSDGALLTWGRYSDGALGLGDPRYLECGAPGGFRTNAERARAATTRLVPQEVEVPTRVRFDHDEEGGKKKERFVFGATAAGWSTGALCIDLEDKENPSLSAQPSTSALAPTASPPMPGAFPTPPEPPVRTGTVGRGLAGGFRGLPHIRIGFAGRGAYRGRGVGTLLGRGRGETPPGEGEQR